VSDAAQIFAWAEEAVEDVVLDIDPGLAPNWRTVSPEGIGLGKDDWLLASRRMLKRFNALAQGVTSISISEPARLPYRTKDLIDFVGAIADAAEQVA
jgi:hypothetical protein